MAASAPPTSDHHDPEFALPPAPTGENILNHNPGEAEMAETSNTDAEKVAAWGKAQTYSDHNPDQYRLDNVPFGGECGPVLEWEKFGTKAQGGWAIDALGRARVFNYKLADAGRADKEQKGIVEAANKKQRQDACKSEAAAAGIPDAWALYERIYELEGLVRQLQARNAAAPRHR